MMSAIDLPFADPAFAGADRRSDGLRDRVRPLSDARLGEGGVIRRVGVSGDAEAAELERRLLEFGFVEGAHVKVIHQGAFGGDPIAVRLDDMRVALRRHEAKAISVLFDTAGPAR